MDIHGVREVFDLKTYLLARKVAWEIVYEVWDACFLGMSESDGVQLVESAYLKRGIEKKWHITKFRIGPNTQLAFQEVSDPNVRLCENGICFIDIGPVFKGHEADVADTFIFGKNEAYLNLKNATKIIFDKTAKHWRETKASGPLLYEFAKHEAKLLGYTLKEDSEGHRLGDFPHHLFYRGGLLGIEDSPRDYLWVLEIHLLDEGLGVGAFYEDILIRKP